MNINSIESKKASAFAEAFFVAYEVIMASGADWLPVQSLSGLAQNELRAGGESRGRARGWGPTESGRKRLRAGGESRGRAGCGESGGATGGRLALGVHMRRGMLIEQISMPLSMRLICVRLSGD
ncbi:MAG: hypothetical protein K2M59_00225 [Muribaculaceae bacterium]|nr:hypothetical protein [Muribaculaceae bacterium]